MKGCRPWFGIDGCHLKGLYGGILLSILSLDAKKGMFPIAIVVVEVECKESWRFFLTELHEALLFVPERKNECLTIMSNMQKVNVQFCKVNLSICIYANNVLLYVYRD